MKVMMMILRSLIFLFKKADQNSWSIIFTRSVICLYYDV